MKTLYLDCGMGAAGDMLTAALSELLPDQDAFFEKMNALGIQGVHFEKEKTQKCGITGTHSKVTVNGEEEESLDVIRNVFNGPECYAICEKENGKAIGAIELKLKGHTDMTDREDECELGYWLGQPFWGKGYMPEAAKEILRHGFEELGMNTIWCGYYEGNQKSKRVQEKVGFVYHHTCENVPVPLLKEVRTGHTNVMTKAHWEEINEGR